MTARRSIVIAMLAGIALVAAPTLTGHDPRLIWNASASVPVGLYRIAPAGRIQVTDLVAVLPPEPLADFLAKRGYLARNVPLIKRVLALPGTTVCRSGTTIIAYDHAYGEARERDSLGRDLPSWQGCRQLGDGEVFLMNWDAADSFDGRYFGPLPASSIVGRLVPVWTDANGDGRFRWRTEDTVLAPWPFRNRHSKGASPWRSSDSSPAPRPALPDACAPSFSTMSSSSSHPKTQTPRMRRSIA